MQTDYPLKALTILLEADCLPERYHPLLPYKMALLAELPLLGCRTKSDAEKLSDGDLLKAGLPDLQTVCLFRRFLGLYDAPRQKFREIEKIAADPAQRAAFYELYALPGVKAVRAGLYYLAGYRSLQAFAAASTEEILARTALAIREHSLSCIQPLPKDVRTQIAVAKAFTEF